MENVKRTKLITNFVHKIILTSQITIRLQVTWNDDNDDDNDEAEARRE